MSKLNSNRYYVANSLNGEALSLVGKALKT